MENAVSGRRLDCPASGLVWKTLCPQSYNAKEGTSHLKLPARNPVATNAPDSKTTVKTLIGEGED